MSALKQNHDYPLENKFDYQLARKIVLDAQ